MPPPVMDAPTETPMAAAPAQQDVSPEDLVIGLVHEPGWDALPYVEQFKKIQQRFNTDPHFRKLGDPDQRIIIDAMLRPNDAQGAMQVQGQVGGEPAPTPQQGIITQPSPGMLQSALSAFMPSSAEAAAPGQSQVSVAPVDLTGGQPQSAPVDMTAPALYRTDERTDVPQPNPDAYVPTAGGVPSSQPALGPPQGWRQTLAENVPGPVLAAGEAVSRAADATVAGIPSLVYRGIRALTNAPTDVDDSMPTPNEVLPPLSHAVTNPSEHFLSGTPTGQFPERTAGEDLLRRGIELGVTFGATPYVWGQVIPLLAERIPLPRLLAVSAGGAIGGALGKSPDNPWGEPLGELVGILGAEGAVRAIQAVNHALFNPNPELRKLFQQAEPLFTPTEMTFLASQGITRDMFSTPETLSDGALYTIQQMFEQHHPRLAAEFRLRRHELRYQAQQAEEGLLTGDPGDAAGAVSAEAEVVRKARLARALNEGQTVAEQETQKLLEIRLRRQVARLQDFSADTAADAERQQRLILQQLQQNLEELRSDPHLSFGARVAQEDAIRGAALESQWALFQKQMQTLFQKADPTHALQGSPVALEETLDRLDAWVREQSIAVPGVVDRIHEALKPFLPAKAPADLPPGSFGRLTPQGQPSPAQASPLPLQVYQDASSQLLRAMRETQDRNMRRILGRYHEGVWGAMEAAAEASGVPEVVQNINNAKAVYGRKINTFMDGPGQLFLEGHPGGPLVDVTPRPRLVADETGAVTASERTWNPEYTPGQILPRLLGTGSGPGVLSPMTADKLRDFRQYWETVKTQPGALEGVQDVLAYDLYDTVMRNGTVDPAAVTRWVRNRRALFDEFPAMGRPFTGAANLRQTLADTEVRSANTLGEFRPRVEDAQRMVRDAQLDAQEAGVSRAALQRQLEEREQALLKEWTETFGDQSRATALLDYDAASTVTGRDIRAVLQEITGESGLPTGRGLGQLQRLLNLPGIATNPDAKRGILRGLWENYMARATEGSPLRGNDLPGRPIFYAPKDVDTFLDRYKTLIEDNFGTDFHKNLATIARSIRAASHEIVSAHETPTIPYKLRDLSTRERMVPMIAAGIIGNFLFNTWPLGLYSGGIAGGTYLMIRAADAIRMHLVKEAFFNPAIAKSLTEGLRGVVPSPLQRAALLADLQRLGISPAMMQHEEPSPPSAVK